MLMLTLMLMLMLLLLLLPDSCCCCCFCFCFCGYLWTVLNTSQVESRISECALSFSAKYIWRTIRKDVTNQQQKQQRWRPIVWNASFLVLSSLPIGRFWPTRNTVLNFLKNGPIFQFQKYVFRMRGLEFETVFSECSSTIHNSNIWFGPNCVDGFFFDLKRGNDFYWRSAGLNGNSTILLNHFPNARRILSINSRSNDPKLLPKFFLEIHHFTQEIAF